MNYIISKEKFNLIDYQYELVQVKIIINMKIK